MAALGQWVFGTGTGAPAAGEVKFDAAVAGLTDGQSAAGVITVDPTNNAPGTDQGAGLDAGNGGTVTLTAPSGTYTVPAAVIAGTGAGPRTITGTVTLAGTPVADAEALTITTTPTGGTRVAHPKPIRLTNPLIWLGDQDVSCFAYGIHITGDEDDDLSTFCDPSGYAWTAAIDFRMSLGTDSLEAALNALGGPGTVVPITFSYDKGTNVVGTPPTGTEDNPVWTGEVRIVPWPIVDAGINEPTSFTMDMPIIGDIVRDPVVT